MNVIMPRNNLTRKQYTAITLISSHASTCLYCFVSYKNITIDFAFNYLFCHVTIFCTCNESIFEIMKIQDEQFITSQK